MHHAPSRVRQTSAPLLRRASCKTVQWGFEILTRAQGFGSDYWYDQILYGRNIRYGRLECIDKSGFCY